MKKYIACNRHGYYNQWFYGTRVIKPNFNQKKGNRKVAYVHWQYKKN